MRVWAPSAERVDIVVEGRVGEPAVERVVALEGPDDRGWWSVPRSCPLGPGDRYAFSVDGGPARPDPRSPSQPDGVDGRSAVVDHGRFPWTDQNWRRPSLEGAVVYELHVGTFSEAGTFAGVGGHLDHLVGLGVTHVELMPVNQFPGRWGWGYDGVDLYAPHNGYGGPDGLKALVDLCHSRGLGVLIDVVYNHLGPAGNYLGQFGPYFTDRYATPWGQAVNLDGPDSDEVREFFLDNAESWLRDYHADGLRIDAVHAILDTSALHLLEEMVERCGAEGVLIAESDLNDPRVIRARDAGGYGVHAQWSDDFHHAVHAVVTGERDGYYADFGSMAQLAKALRQSFVYDGCYAAHRRRRHGRSPDGLPPGRFLAYVQTHDQVGNRAQGERLGHLVGPGRLRAAAALMLCSPFVPMLFQGEEWGASAPFQYFTGHEDPELGKAVSEGRRREFSAFGWAPEDVPDPQDPATFERSRLDWSELGAEPHASLLDWYRRLVALRREHRLHEGSVDVHFDEAARWLVLDRDTVVAAMNFGDAPVVVPIGDGHGGEVVLSEGEVEVDGPKAELGPDAVVVLR